MTAEVATYAGVALAGLLLSATYSGLETGLYTLNRVRLAVRADRGNRAARRLRAMLDAPSKMLATLLLGNNIANYAGSFGVAGLLTIYGFTPVQVIVINAAILIPLLFIGGETLPKDLFRTHTDHWSYTWAGFLTWTARVLTWTGLVPLVRGFGALVSRLIGGDASAAMTARQRVSQLIKEGVRTGALSEEQTSLADRALALRDVTVVGEMVPWPRVAAIGADATREQRRRFLRRHTHTRSPVVAERGQVVGVVSTLDMLLEPEKTPRDLMEPALFLHPNMAVRTAIQRLRAERCAMAVVVRANTRQSIGIVTLKDLVEPLTGELAAW
jgi:putative hemolysin